MTVGDNRPHYDPRRHDILAVGEVDFELSKDALRGVLADWVDGREDDDGSSDDILDETLATDIDKLASSSGADWFIISQGDKITDFKQILKDGDLVTYSGVNT